MLKIGTPLSDSALKVMLLGGGELGKEVVIALQRFGVETIVVDRYANTPAMQVAHSSHVINMTDPEVLRQLIHSIRPQIIVPEIEALNTDVLAEIEAEGLADFAGRIRERRVLGHRVGAHGIGQVRITGPPTDQASGSFGATRRGQGAELRADAGGRADAVRDGDEVMSRVVRANLLDEQ